MGAQSTAHLKAIEADEMEVLQPQFILAKHLNLGSRAVFYGLNDLQMGSQKFACVATCTSC